MSQAARAIALTVATALLIPAASQAAVPSPASVAKRVQKAQGQTARTVKLARADSARTSTTLRAARRQVSAAARDARKLARSARTDRQRLAAAGAAALVAARLSDDVRAYSQAVGETAGQTQAAVARALPGSVAGLDSMLGLLGQIGVALTDDDRAKVHEAITALIAKLPATVGDIAAAVQAPGVPLGVGGLLESALGSATAALQDALSSVQAVVGTLSPDVQRLIGDVLGLVDQQMGSIGGIVASVSGIVGSMLDRCLGLVRSIVGGLFGAGNPDGSTEQPSGRGSSMFGSLLPGFGGLFDRLLSLPMTLLGGSAR